MDTCHAIREATATPRSVVVTRPARDAVEWVAALQAAGHRAVCLPLMAFGPPPQPDTVQACLDDVPGCSVLMFVSPHAVHTFWSLFNEQKMPPAQFGKAFIASFFEDRSRHPGRALRCWAPGPGTARALLQVGVPASCIDQPAPDALQFDSEALWAVVQHSVKPGDKVMVVRGSSTEATGSGGSGRDWLAAQCVAQGSEVLHCVVYSRVAPVWSAAQCVLAREVSGPCDVWLLSSSESAAHLAALLPGHDWSRTVALATHPRIARAAAGMGFGRLLHSRPALDDVLRTLDDEARASRGEALPPRMPAAP
jgi:uroporphyrinogen-III synthase